MLGLRSFCIMLAGPRQVAHNGCDEGLYKTTHSRRGWDLQEQQGPGPLLWFLQEGPREAVKVSLTKLPCG